MGYFQPFRFYYLSPRCPSPVVTPLFHPPTRGLSLSLSLSLLAQAAASVQHMDEARRATDAAATEQGARVATVASYLRPYLSRPYLTPYLPSIYATEQGGCCARRWLSFHAPDNSLTPAIGPHAHRFFSAVVW